MKKFLASTAMVAVMAVSGAALAAPVTIEITSVVGEWTNVVGGSNVSTTAPGADPAELRWGGANPQSGYDFDGAAPPPIINIAADQVFDLGTFTHLNFPIPAGTSISEATLSVTITGTATNGSSVPLSLTSDFIFDHFETPNGANPCANGEPNNQGVNINGCADIVTPTLNAGTSETFTIDGATYVLDVTGFDLGSSFETVENQANSATLRGVFTQVSTPVPEPTTLALLGAGLAGLGVAARRRRKA